jgi:microcystin-dependent protein
MAEPFLSELRLFTFNFAPKGWAMCNGQLLPINQNQGLFSLLGTTFGGDGRVNFALPDLRGRVPLHRGTLTLGQQGGEAAHTITVQEMPQHVHTLIADNALPAAAGGQSPATNKRLSRSSPGNLYGAQQNAVAMDPGMISNVGGSQPHANTQPFLTLTFCIALQGIFPSRN